MGTVSGGCNGYHKTSRLQRAGLRGSWDGKDRGLGLEENKVCTKQLVLQHIKLVLVKTSTNIGEELPTESRAQQAPGGFGGAREELLILQVWEEGRWLKS